MKINKELIKILLLLVGGIGITLSGINWYIGIAAWIAPVFLLMYTRRIKWVEFIFFFVVIAVSGMISQTSNNLSHQVSVNIINGVSFGLFYSIAYLVDKALYRKNGPFYYTLLFPSGIVLVEFVVSSLIGTWGIIAHTQFEVKPLLQLVSITGIFGVSFLVTWFASIVNWIFEKKSDYRSGYKSVLIYVIILCAVLLYGAWRSSFLSPTGDTVKVATVLSETDIHQIVEKEKEALKELSVEYDAEIPSRIFSDSISVRKLISRTAEASNQNAKIIVWNEIALVLNQEQKKELLSEIQAICQKEEVYVLVAFLEECTDENKKPFNNTSILISPDGQIVWEYLKSFLHPMAEAPLINSGGAEIPVVQTEYGKIGNVICYDLDMNNYIKQAGKQAVDILMVPAYDWEEITPLHAQMACLEAIQFGFSLVRSNGKGLTAIYDYLGNSLASVNTLTSDAKIVYADVPVRSVKTAYSSLGDIIILLAILFILFLIVKKIIKRKKSSSF